MLLNSVCQEKIVEGFWLREIAGISTKLLTNGGKIKRFNALTTPG
jgi:hypothetical protein